MKITKNELKQLVEQEMGITEGWFNNIFKKEKKPAPKKEKLETDKDEWDISTYGYREAMYDFRRAIKYKSPGGFLLKRYLIYMIREEPYLAVEYAEKALGERWPEAEEALKKTPTAWKAWNKYCQIFPEAEKEFKNENKIMRITKSELKQMIKEELEDERDENGLLPVGAASRQVDKWDEHWPSAFQTWWQDNSKEMSSLNLDQIARLAFQAGFYEAKK